MSDSAAGTDTLHQQATETSIHSFLVKSGQLDLPKMFDSDAGTDTDFGTDDYVDDVFDDDGFDDDVFDDDVPTEYTRWLEQGANRKFTYRGESLGGRARQGFHNHNSKVFNSRKTNTDGHHYSKKFSQSRPAFSFSPGKSGKMVESSSRSTYHPDSRTTAHALSEAVASELCRELVNKILEKKGITAKYPPETLISELVGLSFRQILQRYDLRLSEEEMKMYCKT